MFSIAHPYVDLGGTLELFAAFKELAQIDDSPKWNALFGVVHAEGAELDAEYAAQVADQAQDFLNVYDMSEHATWVLEQLADMSFTKDQPRDEDGRWTDGFEFDADADTQEWRDTWSRDNKKLAAKNKDVKALFSELKDIADDSVVCMNAAEDEPDLNILAKRGERISADNRTMKLGQRNQCHANTSRLYAAGKVDAIVTGYALCSDGGWRQHTWGMKKNNVVETTYEYLAYYGTRLVGAEAKAFAKSQGVKTKSLDAWESVPKEAWQHLLDETKSADQPRDENGRWSSDGSWTSSDIDSMLEETEESAPTGKIKKDQEWLDSLSDDEKAAFDTWTDNGYTEMRQFEKTGRPAYMKDDVEAMKAAVARAKPYSGMMWRGMYADDAAFEKITNSKTMTMEAMTSFSSSRGIATDFTGGPDDTNKVLIQAFSKTAKPITFEVEHEFIATKGTRFRVEQVVKRPGRAIIVLVEQ